MIPVNYINLKFPDGSCKRLHPDKAFEQWLFYNLDRLYQMWDILEKNSMTEKTDFSKFSKWVFKHSSKYIDATL